jgi:hypothetical protein
MISTVVTSTVSTITLVGSFTLIAVLLLLGFLIQKEITSVSGNEKFANLGRVINIGIAPLLVVFLFSIAAKVAETLK